MEVALQPWVYGGRKQVKKQNQNHNLRERKWNDSDRIQKRGDGSFRSELEFMCHVGLTSEFIFYSLSIAAAVFCRLGFVRCLRDCQQQQRDFGNQPKVHPNANAGSFWTAWICQRAIQFTPRILLRRWRGHCSRRHQQSPHTGMSYSSL